MNDLQTYCPKLSPKVKVKTKCLKCNVWSARFWTDSPFHTAQEETGKVVLFLWLGLPSTLICHENEALLLRLNLSSTLIPHENAALFLRLNLPSTLIPHENEALFLRLDLPSTLICHENEALLLRLGLLSTLIRHENRALFLRGSTVRPTVHTINPSRKRSFISTVRPQPRPQACSRYPSEVEAWD